MASPKTLARLEAQIQRRAAYCLQFEISDPRRTFVTITRVELAKDLAVAKVFYSVLGDEAERSKAAHMLQGASGFIQRQVAGILRTRRTPELRFIFDASIEEADRLASVIRAARERDLTINPDADSAMGDAASGPEGEAGPAPSDEPDRPDPESTPGADAP